MAKFRFRLEPVLQQRLREEERAQRTVAALERQRLDAETALRDAHARLRACKTDLGAALGRGAGGGGGEAGEASRGPTPIDFRGVRMQSAASFRFFGEAQRLAIHLAGAHQRTEGARQTLLRATTARKAVESLKQKRYDEWRREQEKREAAATDELVVMRFGRGDGGLGSPGRHGMETDE